RPPPRAARTARTAEEAVARSPPLPRTARGRRRSRGRATTAPRAPPPCESCLGRYRRRDRGMARRSHHAAFTPLRNTRARRQTEPAVVADGSSAVSKAGRPRAAAPCTRPDQPEWAGYAWGAVVVAGVIQTDQRICRLAGEEI